MINPAINPLVLSLKESATLAINLKALELQQELEKLQTTIETQKNEVPEKSNLAKILDRISKIKDFVTKKFERKHWIALASVVAALCFILLIFFLFSGAPEGFTSHEDYLDIAEKFREQQRYTEAIMYYKREFRINPSFSLFFKLIVIYIEKLGYEHASLPYIIFFLVFVIIASMLYSTYMRR